MEFAVFFYWGVQSPLSYRRHKLSGRFLYAHIASIVILPLPAAFIHLRYGYIIDDVPAIFCVGKNADATYYTFILPISIILTVTTCLLILIFWKIIKVSYWRSYSSDTFPLYM